ncbi:hypothetical protein BHE74_00023964 [Ensete ventricosum]|nr:hypothetical protein GW17_00030973 [Ensete ventricosum]RWW68511.1 hypothetical protein BHE74_00023964 [Ensete ventricosum]RZS02513.1 hypothetical protein BHM03_00032582 [Ensete ventricosum]
MRSRKWTVIPVLRQCGYETSGVFPIHRRGSSCVAHLLPSPRTEITSGIRVFSPSLPLLELEDSGWVGTRAAARGARIPKRPCIAKGLRGDDNWSLPHTLCYLSRLWLRGHKRIKPRFVCGGDPICQLDPPVLDRRRLLLGSNWLEVSAPCTKSL